MNNAHFFKGLDNVPEIFIGTILIYLLIIVYTKIFGLKSFSKMTSFDFAHTIAIGSLIASTISTGQPSLLVGALLLGFLFLFNYFVSIAQFRSERLENMIENNPILLMRNGEILHDNLRKTIVTESELRGKLREANVLQLSEVQAVVLETTGDVSVLHGDVEIDDYILEGVKS